MITSYLVRSALLLLLAILSTQAQDSSSTSIETLEDYTARLQEQIQEEFDQQNETFALWVGISDPDYGDLYFVFGNGTSTSAGALPDTPATLDQRFDIGSISKTMGGTTIMQMVEQGILNLTDTVQQLIPDFAVQFPEYANNTVEELLRMKTIVPDFLNDEEGLLNDYSQDITKRYTPEDIVAYALQKYPSDPGIYSTTNFIVLEVIAEALTGESIEALVEDYVFQPLRLTATTMPNRYSDGVHPPPAATPYAGPGCAHELSNYGYADAVVYEDITEFSQGIVMAGIGGSINSNIYDLLAWAKSGTGDALLGEEMVERRHVYDSAVAEGFLLYGMAQYIDGDFILMFEPYMEGWAGHNGDAFGFGANAFHNEALNASVSTAMNTCGYTGLHDAVIRIVSDEIKARNTTTTMAPTQEAQLVVDESPTAVAEEETGTPDTTAEEATTSPIDATSAPESTTTTEAPADASQQEEPTSSASLLGYYFSAELTFAVAMATVTSIY